MKASKINTTLVDGYISLLNNLSAINKLDLITKLTNSVNANLNHNQSAFKEAFGAFESSKTAEEIIKEIKESRLSNRQIESFSTNF